MRNLTENYWNDDYYFCEDKILATMSDFFGCRHELMFSGAFNFGYYRDKKKENTIGNRMAVKYFEQKEFLEKYYGIIVQKYDFFYGGEQFFEKSKSKLSMGIPVSVGLDNSCRLWPEKPGEEMVDVLPFFIISIDCADTIEMIDSHELGIKRKISKEKFIKSYRWGAVFCKDDTKKEAKINRKEFILSILHNTKNTVVAEHGCSDIDLSFSSISSNMDKFKYREQHDMYQEMLMLAEDVLSMDLKKEVGGLTSVLFVPFYFGLLMLYRSRLVFTKALHQVEEELNTQIFHRIIQRLIVSSSKWNYIRMVFTNCYHSGEMDIEVKKNMSDVIKEIACHEKRIYEEFVELYEQYKSDTMVYCSDISKFYNTHIFNSEKCLNVEEKKAVYGRYYYKGKSLIGKRMTVDNYEFMYYPSISNGDSLVCLNQTLTLEDVVTSQNWQVISIYGSVFYNEMIYDYIELSYSDGTTQEICLGFDGWIRNKYQLQESAAVLWEGIVMKSDGKETSYTKRKAAIYGKKYCLIKGKKISHIVLPNNPFINIVGITFEK